MLRITTLWVTLLTLTPALQAQPEEALPRRPARYHYRQDSPERIKIEKALETIIEPGVVLKGNPWQLMDAIGKHFDIRMDVNEDGLMSEGIPDDYLPNWELPAGITLREALNAIVSESSTTRPHDPALDYFIQYDMLVLTSRFETEDTMEMVVYELRDFPEQAVDEANEIADLLTAHFDGWEVTGTGHGTATSFPGGVVVRQSQRQHRAILTLLDQLREVNSVPAWDITTEQHERFQCRMISATANEQKVYAAFRTPAPAGLTEVRSLRHLANFLEESLGVPVILYVPGLREEGMLPETEIELRQLATLGHSLDYSLDGHLGVDVRVEVRNASIIIKPDRRTAADYFVQVYDTSQLTDQIRSDSKLLTEICNNAIVSEWTEPVPPGPSFTPFPNGIVATVDARGHERLRDLFTQLIEFSAQRGYPAPIVPEQPEPVHYYGGTGIYPIPSKGK